MLKDNVLTYHENDLEGAKSLGTIDIRNAVYVDMFNDFLVAREAPTQTQDSIQTLKTQTDQTV